MRRVFLYTLLAAMPLLAQAPRSQGYVFQGFGSGWLDDAFGHTGGGGEALFYKGFGIGGDIGAIYGLGRRSTVIGNLNVNGVYHFTVPRRYTRWDPFLTAGYSLYFRNGSVNGFNFGGGTVYWFRSSLGLRLDARYARAVDNGPRFPEFRFGLAFR